MIYLQSLEGLGIIQILGLLVLIPVLVLGGVSYYVSNVGHDFLSNFP